jgi:hypothetical protein
MRTTSDGAVAKGWDHDLPAARKWTPLGILMVVSGTLTLLFGSKETSDFWADGLKVWWSRVSAGCRSIRRLVISLDNGPNCSGTRTQFLKRMVEFADWSGLEVRLVYYPPYHSKYIRLDPTYAPRTTTWGLLGARRANSTRPSPITARRSALTRPTPPRTTTWGSS